MYLGDSREKLGFPGGSDGKESACNAGDLGSIPGLRRSPRVWPPTSVFLPGESHGQRSLVSPWGHKESDMTERLNTHTHTHTHRENVRKFYELVTN